MASTAPAMTTYIAPTGNLVYAPAGSSMPAGSTAVWQGQPGSRGENPNVTAAAAASGSASGSSSGSYSGSSGGSSGSGSTVVRQESLPGGSTVTLYSDGRVVSVNPSAGATYETKGGESRYSDVVSQELQRGTSGYVPTTKELEQSYLPKGVTYQGPAYDESGKLIYAETNIGSRTGAMVPGTGMSVYSGGSLTRDALTVDTQAGRFTGAQALDTLRLQQAAISQARSEGRSVITPEAWAPKQVTASYPVMFGQAAPSKEVAEASKVAAYTSSVDVGSLTKGLPVGVSAVGGTSFYSPSLKGQTAYDGSQALALREDSVVRRAFGVGGDPAEERARLERQLSLSYPGTVKRDELFITDPSVLGQVRVTKEWLGDRVVNIPRFYTDESGKVVERDVSKLPVGVIGQYKTIEYLKDGRTETAKVLQLSTDAGQERLLQEGLKGRTASLLPGFVETPGATARFSKSGVAMTAEDYALAREQRLREGVYATEAEKLSSPFSSALGGLALNVYNPVAGFVGDVGRGALGVAGVDRIPVDVQRLSTSARDLFVGGASLLGAPADVGVGVARSLPGNREAGVQYQAFSTNVIPYKGKVVDVAGGERLVEVYNPSTGVMDKLVVRESGYRTDLGITAWAADKFGSTGGAVVNYDAPVINTALLGASAVTGGLAGQVVKTGAAGAATVGGISVPGFVATGAREVIATSPFTAPMVLSAGKTLLGSPTPFEEAQAKQELLTAAAIPAVGFGLGRGVEASRGLTGGLYSRAYEAGLGGGWGVGGPKVDLSSVPSGLRGALEGKPRGVQESAVRQLSELEALREARARATGEVLPLDAFSRPLEARAVPRSVVDTKVDARVEARVRESGVEAAAREAGREAGSRALVVRTREAAVGELARRGELARLGRGELVVRERALPDSLKGRELARVEPRALEVRESRLLDVKRPGELDVRGKEGGGLPEGYRDPWKDWTRDFKESSVRDTSYVEKGGWVFLPNIPLPLGLPGSRASGGGGGGGGASGFFAGRSVFGLKKDEGSGGITDLLSKTISEVRFGKSTAITGLEGKRLRDPVTGVVPSRELLQSRVAGGGVGSPFKGVLSSKRSRR